MYTRNLPLLESIHVRCVLAMSHVVCNRCSGWVHSKCVALQNAEEYRRIKDGVYSSCSCPPALPKPQLLPPSIPTQGVNRNYFTCTGSYLPSLDHLMTTTDTLILGDLNAHHSAWYSSSTDTKETLLENMISGSNFCIPHWNAPTRLPSNANSSSPYVSLA